MALSSPMMTKKDAPMTERRTPRSRTAPALSPKREISVLARPNNFTSSAPPMFKVSFIIAFMIIFALFLLDKFLAIMPAYMVPVLQYLSIDYHFNNIGRGVIDTRDIAYYLSLIVFMLALAKLSLESRKWS